MKVRYTPRAFADREQILDWLQERSPTGARNVANSLLDAIAQLGEYPASGYRTSDPRIRVAFVGRYPYKIFYRVREDAVEILHIRHASRRPWPGDR
jgi:plasmid stabilization system protein ParE